MNKLNHSNTAPIGEALKQMRKAYGLTQSQMAAGVISESYYSKVERGDNRINADALVNLLVSHHFDVGKFFDRLVNQSSVEPDLQIATEISIAQYTKNLKRLDELSKELKTRPEGSPSWLELRITLAYAWINHSPEQVPDGVKNKIKKIILEDNWNRGSYQTFCNSIIIYEIEEAAPLVRNALEHFVANPEYDEFTLQYVALIAVNFLNCAYHASKEERKSVHSTICQAIEFLKNDLPVEPAIGFYKIMGVYYKALFDGKLSLVNHISEIVKEIGYGLSIEDLKEK